MKKLNKTTMHFVIIYALLVACTAAIVMSFLLSPTTAKDIFRVHARTVVEVKVYNDVSNPAFGSAVAINRQGLFITNAHVIAYRELIEYRAFENIWIRFATDEHFVRAEFVNKDVALDLATIQIDASNVNIRVANIRTSSVMEGERVYAIGNAQNHGVSMLEGIVSKREVHIRADGRDIVAIQTSVMITNGNSGGALLDANGNLVGITTFRLRDAANNTIYGISFAIPMSVVIEFVE